jgi:hypothetical protein
MTIEGQHEFRTMLLNALAQRLDTNFGNSGKIGGFFREVKRGYVGPVNVYPTLVVADNGQSKGDVGDDESSDRVLSIRIMCYLAENWDRLDAKDDWTDRVEKIIHDLENWLPEGTGGERMEYKTDDPFDVLFTSGASAAVWVIDFEYTYFREAHESDDFEE